jgi:hypothetical protein
MIDLKTNSFHRDWLPSFDLHERDGELVVHAEVHGPWEEVEVSIDGGDLVVRPDGPGADPAHFSRLPLPFPPAVTPRICRPSPEILEVHIPIPD